MPQYQSLGNERLRTGTPGAGKRLRKSSTNKLGLGLRSLSDEKTRAVTPRETALAAGNPTLGRTSSEHHLHAATEVPREAEDVAKEAAQTPAALRVAKAVAAVVPAPEAGQQLSGQQINGGARMGHMRIRLEVSPLTGRGPLRTSSS